jgi:UDP-N-acetylglucosamine--N-acetylmuramyl-(pentapeptide) pyrophosphoryl-undecaprenol N-acetylglucosamine transferase
VYPALAVLKALTKAERFQPGVESLPSGSSETGLETLWIGSVGGMEAGLVKREGVAFEAIPAAGLHGVSLRAMPNNLLQLGRGTSRSRAILRRFKPDVMFFTGGYLAMPMALAARSLLGARTPTAMYVPDIEPGLALKTLAHFSDVIALTAEDSQPYFRRHSKVTVTGYPTRPELAGWSIDAARRFLKIRPDLPTLLVFGGSKGAHSINQAVVAVLPELLTEMQIVHLSGSADWPEVDAWRGQLAQDLSERYRAYPYLHEEMGAALCAADLVVSRAGASTLGEFPLFGLPAILVPYPYAWRYQMVNAGYLTSRGAALVLNDAELSVKLAPMIRSTIHDPQKLQGMRDAMKALARPQAAAAIADLLSDQARRRRTEI